MGVWIDVLLASGAAVVMAATLFGFLGQWWWGWDLFSHFRVQYFWTLSLITPFLFLTGRWFWGCSAGILALVNLIMILPYYRNRPLGVDHKPQFTLALANVNTANPHHHRVRSWLQDVASDFIVLVEVDQGWLEDLNLAELGYPYELAAPLGDNYGLAVYSRHPMVDSTIRYFGDLKRPSLAALVVVGSAHLNIVVSHPPPPKSGRLSRFRDEQIMEVMDYVRGLDGPVLFCGDLNTTPWSAAYRTQMAAGGLVDSRQGFGLQPTWPTWVPVFYIPIDHIWLSAGIRVLDRRIGPRNGSDHRPVILDFSLNMG